MVAVSDRRGALGVYATSSPSPSCGDWNGVGAHTNFFDQGHAARKADGTPLSPGAKRSGRMWRSTSTTTALVSPSDSRAPMRQHTTPVQPRDVRPGGFHPNPAGRGQGQEGLRLEADRRPNANMDPHTVCRLMVTTVCRGRRRRSQLTHRATGLGDRRLGGPSLSFPSPSLRMRGHRS